MKKVDTGCAQEVMLDQFYLSSCKSSQVRVYKKEEHELLPGQFFSDEPGLYIEGEFGIRLETVLRWLLNAIQRHTTSLNAYYAMSDCLYVCTMRLKVYMRQLS